MREHRAEIEFIRNFLQTLVTRPDVLWSIGLAVGKQGRIDRRQLP